MHSWHERVREGGIQLSPAHTNAKRKKVGGGTGIEEEIYEETPLV
jgi:hypothetical protein